MKIWPRARKDDSPGWAPDLAAGPVENHKDEAPMNGPAATRARKDDSPGQSTARVFRGRGRQQHGRVDDPDES